MTRKELAEERLEILERAEGVLLDIKEKGVMVWTQELESVFDNVLKEIKNNVDIIGEV